MSAEPREGDALRTAAKVSARTHSLLAHEKRLSWMNLFFLKNNNNTRATAATTGQRR
jgi:hypothetical protein